MASWQLPPCTEAARSQNTQQGQLQITMEEDAPTQFLHMVVDRLHAMEAATDRLAALADRVAALEAVAPGRIVEPPTVHGALLENKYLLAAGMAFRVGVGAEPPEIDARYRGRWYPVKAMQAPPHGHPAYRYRDTSWYTSGADVTRHRGVVTYVAAACPRERGAYFAQLPPAEGHVAIIVIVDDDGPVAAFLGHERLLHPSGSRMSSLPVPIAPYVELEPTPSLVLERIRNEAFDDDEEGFTFEYSEANIVGHFHRMTVRHPATGKSCFHDERNGNGRRAVSKFRRWKAALRGKSWVSRLFV